MEQKKLSKWLKCIFVGMAVCGVVLYAAVFPCVGMSVLERYPEFSNRFWPWLAFIWISGIPCFLVLFFSWKIATNIGKDLSFSESNAKLLQWISAMSAGDAAFFFLGNMVLLCLDMSHPSVVLASFVVVFAGVAVAVASAVLSHLVKKAAVLQDQSDWTI
jgi:hypothetical protein